MHLLRQHVGTLANMLKEGKMVPKTVLYNGGGPENRGGLKRINELFNMLPDYEPREDKDIGG